MRLRRKAKPAEKQIISVARGIQGFSVDDGVPAHGTRYGGDGTIHNTGTIDVVLARHQDGSIYVSEVWFRCMELAARVSYRSISGFSDQYYIAGAQVVAVEVADR